MKTLEEPLSVAPDNLRSVLGRVPTGVMVITTSTPAGPEAKTANSFTSLSLEPPLVSVCFSDKSPFTARLCESGLWGVSVLAADQHELSVHFAHRGTARNLAGIPHRVGELTGAPLLTESLATLECRSIVTQPAGDHTLLIGEVLSLRLHRDTEPLIFYRGRYHSIGST